MAQNQYPDRVQELRSEIEYAKSQLAAGISASNIANELLRKGLSVIDIVIVGRETTGASLGDLKSFGKWWGEGGVTDAEGFDEWASQVFGS